MMASDRMLLVADQVHVEADIDGGVQVCTREYRHFLTAAGYDVQLLQVNSSRRLSFRLRHRLGLDHYETYDAESLAPRIVAAVDAYDCSVVALNQMALAVVIPAVKRLTMRPLRFVVLSHGNESGDFLHEVVRGPQRPWWLRWQSILRLGQLLVIESRLLSRQIDVVVCLSNTEAQINRWLGARATFFLPRQLVAELLDWQPNPKRFGFVGTLNHRPNLDGVLALAEHLDRANPAGLRIRLVGGPTDLGESLARSHPCIEYVGRLDEAALAHEASTWTAFLNPVLWFSRGASTKLAKGVGWGIPVISTPAGNRGYRWSAGGVITVRDAVAMVSAMNQLAEDSEAACQARDQVLRLLDHAPDPDTHARAFRELLQADTGA